jgi:hypothetical protein
MRPKNGRPITAMKYSRGLNRVYGLFCGIWFLAWLVAFPLYTRSKDLRDREFFAQKIYIPTTFEESLADLTPKLAADESERMKLFAEEPERIKLLFKSQEFFLQENPRLAEEFAREEKRVTGEIIEQVTRASQTFSASGRPADPFTDRAYRAALHRIWERRTDLARNQALRLAREQAGIVNTYKQPPYVRKDVALGINVRRGEREGRSSESATIGGV